MLWFCSTRATIIFFRKNHHELSWNLKDLMCSRLWYRSWAPDRDLFWTPWIGKAQSCIWVKISCEGVELWWWMIADAAFRGSLRSCCEASENLFDSCFTAFPTDSAFQDGDFTLYGKH
jgi:hypothetical protein